MSLFERGIVESSVSFGKLLMNPKQQITGHTDFDLADYCRAIARSGFPGITEKSAEVTQEVLDSYLRLIADRDLPDYGATVRRPEVLRRPLGTIGRVTAAGVYCGVNQAKKKCVRNPNKYYRCKRLPIWLATKRDTAPNPPAIV